MSTPHMASVVAQFAEWFSASHRFHTGSRRGVKSRR